MTHSLAELDQFDSYLNEVLFPLRPVLCFGRSAKAEPAACVEECVWHWWKDCAQPNLLQILDVTYDFRVSLRTLSFRHVLSQHPGQFPAGVTQSLLGMRFSDSLPRIVLRCRSVQEKVAWLAANFYEVTTRSSSLPPQLTWTMESREECLSFAWVYSGILWS